MLNVAKNSRKRRSTKKRLGLEHLESRRLLASGPWTNPILALDATGDMRISERDALVIINEMARNSEAERTTMKAPPILGHPGGSKFHYDTNGDGRLSPRDVLKIINRIGSGQAAITTPADMIDQTDEPRAGELLTFTNNYARGEGELATSADQDAFRFIATGPRTAVNLAALGDESVTTVRVLDSGLRVVASSSREGSGNRFAGLDFVTAAGQEYFVSIASPLDADLIDFYYAIEVFSYHPADWTPEPDSGIGSDAHGDTRDTSTTLVMPAAFVRVSSHIDSGHDQDVFRVEMTSNRLSVEAFGLEPPNFVVSVVVRDEAGFVRTPVTSIGGDHVVRGAPGESLFVTLFNRSGDTGQYVLDVSQFDPSAEEDDIDPDGDTLETATALVIAEDQSVRIDRSLESTDDVDVFRLRTPAVESQHLFSLTLSSGRVKRDDRSECRRRTAERGWNRRLGGCPKPLGALSLCSRLGRHIGHGLLPPRFSVAGFRGG